MVNKTALIVLLLAMVWLGSDAMPFYFSNDEYDNNKVHPVFGPYASNHFNTEERRMIPRKTKRSRVFIWKHRDHSAAEEAKKILGYLAANYEHSPGK
ncbi:unnamed protein product [Medioppia subpectinata]|uniref:Uncharacterized protein n=1 Tax=Medioppia subpectinata TaxID=1979941 RepID=A0A7R9Q558_9ACAR|nr:unnamed protein product [Medioppia subpectinata]CAG2112413.1 unnamed protein product [Medioppia subpectinata]